MWEYKNEGGITTVITPPKSINYDTLEDFRKLVRELAESGCVKAVINMNRTIYIDSSGLGTLVKAAADLRHSGGDLRLAAVSPGITDILRITSLHKVLKVYKDTESALKSYG
ncbi:anti-sigma factor antagonist [Geovibrio thiophilus]|uniref:Anti-sigma factor antagonist n=1 Tax=Geovibrio thiophilus TaxID=139438 RepID=A0A410JXV0_9BACT|nr:STAS domain-containing protein [Geovibrio thiophilus]QAR32992.1 anti-sigma factor antagonist [Geovibrio thiophilus]